MYATHRMVILLVAGALIGLSGCGQGSSAVAPTTISRSESLSSSSNALSNGTYASITVFVATKSEPVTVTMTSPSLHCSLAETQSLPSPATQFIPQNFQLGNSQTDGSATIRFDAVSGSRYYLYAMNVPGSPSAGNFTLTYPASLTLDGFIATNP